MKLGKLGECAGTSLAQLAAVRQRLPVPIALVLNSFDPGGTEYQMSELMRGIDPRLFTVHAACLADRGALRSRVNAAGLSVTAFPIHSLRSAHTVKQLARFARWCRHRRIQVVHACDFYANVFALPAAALARVPVRIGSRRDVLVHERTAAQQLMQRLAYQTGHRVVANSRAAAERLIEEGVPDWKVVTIANGVDLARYHVDDASGRPPQGKSSRRVITTVAHLRPGKGHDVLLKAAARVVRQIPDVRFRIIGDGPCRGSLERQAAALRVSAHVDFLGHRDDVPTLLRASDVFAFPSLMEASPNAVIEAMAAGLPIVATRVGGIPEVVEHERDGLLVPPANDRDFAAALLRVIEHPDLASRIAEAARKTVETRFSFERMASEFQHLYFDELRARVAPEALTWAASSGH